jgi:replicative DNA helicase
LSSRTGPLSQAVERTYADTLQAMVLTLAELDQPHTITLTPEARDVLAELQEWLEPRLDPQRGQFAAITDWASKLAGAVVRVAALLHLADTLRTGYARPITADTMHAAEHIGRYYLDHALAVFDLMGHSDPDLDDARHLLDWITRTHRHEFTRRDALRALQGQRFTKATDLDPALELLIEHGHIRPRPAETSSKGGRPTTTYEVHPHTHPTP